MTQQLRVLTALAEGLGSVSKTNVTPILGYLTPSSGLQSQGI